MLTRYVLISLKSLILLISLFIASHSSAKPPTLQLATVYHADLDISDYWVSEKLDGVRGYWNGEQLLSRQGYRIAAPDWFTAPLPVQPLDGELWIERGQFDAVSALVRRSTIEAQKDADEGWHQVKFMVFDLPQSSETFSQRLSLLHRIIQDIDQPWIQLVTQQRVSSESALMAWLDEVVAGGGEGLMLHHQDARYQQGRSDRLLKLKQWQDAEARVIGHQPGRGKYIGMLGALLVETPTGIRFKLGSGFTDSERLNPPEIGSLVTYKYTGVSVNGVPRFASFMRIRHP